MTLLFFDGCQDVVLIPKPEYSTGSPWGGVSTGRDGTTNGSAIGGGGGAGTRTLILPSAAATCVFGYAVNLGSAGLGNTGDYTGFCSSLGTVQTVVFINSSGFIEVRRTNATGTLLGTSTGHQPISFGTWHHIAAKVVLNAASAGSVAVKLDDVQVINVTGITTSSVTGSVTHLIFQSGIGVSALIFDDIYVCDTVDATATQGQANNDFLGDVRVSVMFPTAAGDTTTWTPSTGANWSTVDETPPNTTDTNSIVATSTGSRDLYNLTDLAGTIPTVYGLRVGLYASKSDAGSALIKPVIKEAVSGTVTSQAAQGLASGSYGAIYGPFVYTKAAGGLFASTDINSLQAGVEVG